jgi:hypothetical protein
MEFPESTPPRVFISYSHDSPEHEDRVRELADRLRTDGVDAWIDQYSPAPPQGWPMWMGDEIQKANFVLLVSTQTYLRRVEGREEPGKGRGVLWETKLIYNLLYQEDSELQKFIPVLLADDPPFLIPLPLRGLANYRVDTAEGYEDLYRYVTSQPRYEVPVVGKLKRLPAKKPASYPASLGARLASKPTTLEQRHRQQLIKQVRLDWIDGVLDQSLYKVARIELGLVEHPLNATIRIPEREPQAVLPGIPISQIFEEQGDALLILGGPGTVKTTLLLELARYLLLRAEHDENHPIPVVFNLSSWAVRRKPLREWLIAELNERSYVPKKIGTGWVESEQILPLLDGLDEVAGEHRDACVDAINNFRREYGLLPIAVCSRIADYEALGTKPRLRHAVEVQPLTRSQVEDYLERVGEPVRGLRAEAEGDPSLWELLETPLMLWVAMLSYRGVPHTAMQHLSLEERRHQLFGYFIEAMFRRRERKMRFSADQTIRWLSSLACALDRNGQTVFYLESLDFEWLATRAQQWLARGGLIVSSGLSVGLFVGLIDGLGLSLVDGLDVGLREWLDSLPEGLILGLILGLIVGLTGIAIKVKPVEKLAFRWADISSLKGQAIREGFIVWLIGGLIFGLIGGLFFGGLFVLRHLVVRLFLWKSNSGPLRYVPFLEQSKQLLFLRQVGGGYIFVHRLLREYFVSLPVAKNNPKKAQAASAATQD